MEQILPNGQVHQQVGCVHYPPPLPDCMPLAPQMRHTPSRLTPGRHHGQGIFTSSFHQGVVRDMFGTPQYAGLIGTGEKGLQIFGH